MGLIPDIQEIKVNEAKSKQNDQAFEQAKLQLEMERKMAEEKARLMKKKAAMGHTPAFN